MDVGALTNSLTSSRAFSAGKSGGGGDSGTEAPEQAPKSTGGKPVGLYISPVVRYDQDARLAVLYFRDFDTGETRDQIPAERVVEKYRQTGGANGRSDVATDGGGKDGGEAAASVESAASPGIGQSFLAAAAPAGGGFPAGATSAVGGTPGAAAGSLVSFSV